MFNPVFLGCGERVLPSRKDEEVYCWPPKEWVKRYHAKGGVVEDREAEAAVLREKAAKNFNEFVVSATVRLGLKQCPEQSSHFRPGTTLIFHIHQDDSKQCGVDMAQENLGVRLQLKPARPVGPGSQYSYLRATRTRADASTIHIAPREIYIKNVLDILRLGDNKCKSISTPTVQTRQKK